MKPIDELKTSSGLFIGSEPLETVKHRAAASDDKRDDDATDSDKSDTDTTDKKGDSGDDSRDSDGKD